MLASCLDPESLLPKVLQQFDLSGTCCLRFIDPFGDTTFNRVQATALLGELAGLRPKLDGRTRAFIDQVIELAERTEGGVHLYLKFEGD